MKKLLLQWHPDKNPERGEEAKVLFQHLQKELKRCEGGKGVVASLFFLSHAQFVTIAHHSIIQIILCHRPHCFYCCITTLAQLHTAYPALLVCNLCAFGRPPMASLTTSNPSPIASKQFIDDLFVT